MGQPCSLQSPARPGQPRGSLKPEGGELGPGRWGQGSSQCAHFPACKGSLTSVTITGQEGAVAFISPVGSLATLRKTISLGSQVLDPWAQGRPCWLCRGLGSHVHLCMSVYDGITLISLCPAEYRLTHSSDLTLPGADGTWARCPRPQRLSKAALGSVPAQAAG